RRSSCSNGRWARLEWMREERAPTTPNICGSRTTSIMTSRMSISPICPPRSNPSAIPLNGTCCAVGWVGSIAAIKTVSDQIAGWTNSSLGMGWPLFVDQSVKQPTDGTAPTTIPGKIPSALDIFGNTLSFDNTSTYSPAPSKSPPLQRMKDLWQGCVNNDVYN